MNTNPEIIASKLTRGQRSTIKGLDQGFCLLGCSEPTAIRLLEANSRRPALTQALVGKDRERLFALTPVGLLVKEFC